MERGPQPLHRGEGYNPRSRKELDMTEATEHACTYNLSQIFLNGYIKTDNSLTEESRWFAYRHGKNFY